MSEESATLNPLANEPAREAVNPMRGYSYQILCSVRTWITLPSDHLLYLEGAEDFDVVAPGGSTTTQVRYSSNPSRITLRSPGVRQALSNFWSHCQRNSGRNVHFHYLTTSTPGVEQGAPFGPELSGIRLWSRIREDRRFKGRAKAIDTLKAFLVRYCVESPQFQDFLKQCSRTDFESEIIQRVCWDTESHDSQAVYQEIHSHLIALGLSRQVPVDDCDVVVHALYHEAWKVATKDKARHLDKEGFVRIFDQATRISVPKSLLMALVGRVVPEEAKDSDVTAIISDQRAIGSLPPLPSNYFERRALVDRMVAAVAQNTLTILQGSTGMGKTSSSVAVTQRHQQSWGWLSFRGSDTHSALRRLTTVLEEIRFGHIPLHIILDDIDTIEDARAYEPFISGIVEAQRQRKGKLIVCVAQEPSSRLTQSLGLTPGQVLRIPVFSRAEIEGFLLAFECLDDELRTTWAKIIELTTRGHPQLVHARVAFLASQSFPAAGPQDLLQTSADIEDVHTEARKLISSLDVAQRELMYRLSLTACPLRRDQIVAIGSATPSLEEPGTAFDRLIGPWIEHLGEGLYQSSPLAGHVGRSVKGPDWVQSTHFNIATVLLSSKTLSPHEVSEIYLHALTGKNEFAFARLSFSLVSESDETWQLMSDYLSWLVPIGLEGGVFELIERPENIFLLRLLQLNIASRIESNELSRVIERALDEFPYDEAASEDDLARFVLLGQVLLHHPEALQVSRLLELIPSYIVEVDRLQKLIDLPQSTELAVMLRGPSGKMDPATIAGMSVVQRIKSLEGLSELLVGIENWGKNTVQRAFWMVGHDEMTSSALLNQVWLDEYQTPEPDWTRFLELTDRLYRFAVNHELVRLAAAAAKMVSRVMDENQGLSEKSLERAKEFALELGDGPSLQDGRARILTHMGRDREALELWRTALPQWNVEEIDVNVGIGFREAAMAAARLGYWEEAAALFADGAKRLEDESVRTFRVGMTVDEGFASWKSGDDQHALECFKSGLEELESMQIEADRDPVYSLQRRIGHTGMWVSSQAAGRIVPEDYSEPIPGLCSDLEPLKGETDKGTPIDYIFASFVDFEDTCKLGDALFERYADRGTGSEHVSVRVGFLERAFRWRLEKVESDGLLMGIVGLAHCLEITRKQMATGAGKSEEVDLSAGELELSSEAFELVRAYMLVAMFSFVAHGKVTDGLISSWRNEAEKLNLEQGLEDWFQMVEGLFVTGGMDAEEFTKVRDGSWIYQCLASLRWASGDEIDPISLIGCHGLWLSYFERLPKRNLVVNDVAALVAQSWERCADRPFLLRFPRETVPALRSAIAAPVDGWEKVRLILEAALDAVPFEAGTMVRRSLSNEL